MATLSATHPTLLDYAKTLNPDNSVATVIEMLSQTNDITKDMVWQEGNLLTGHRVTSRSGLPTPTWRKLYGGVQPTKGTTAQFTEACGMLEAYSEVDKAMADLHGNTAAYRMTQDRAHVEGMTQEFAATVFRGDESLVPEKFTGFEPRFTSTSGVNGENILLSSPVTSDATSIWLIGWGPDTAFGIYPKGSVMGLQMQDKGQVTIESIDGAGGRMEAYRSHYRWDCGLCVADWRYVVRIQYKISTTTASGSTGPVLADLMAKAIRRIPNLNRVRPAFYMNRTSWDLLDLQANNKGTLAYTTTYDAQGIATERFRGIPIRRCDAILATETALS